MKLRSFMASLNSAVRNCQLMSLLLLGVASPILKEALLVNLICSFCCASDFGVMMM
jgi:hypothetical protein